MPDSRLPTVVFTRPRGQGAALLAGLRARGFGVLEVPAFDIAPAPDPAAVAAVRTRLGEFALIHFASVNAMRGLLGAPGDATSEPAVAPDAIVAVMGPGSRAEALRHPALAGARLVTPGEELAGAPPALDSETLLLTLDAHFPGALAGRRALLVKGDGGRDALARGLAARGMTIEAVETYRRLCPSLAPDQRVALEALADADAPEGGFDDATATADPGDAADPAPALIVATSSEGITNFHAMLAPWPALAAWLARTPVLVTHERVAAKAQALGIAHVRHCPPGDDAILRWLATGAPHRH
ncbi:uroporphyrinogen-III synthase [Derxia gummosa]|uniref:Uroporphyrinogen-III synthase n=1 Tax=Derxia gummosa DSM 723 TaxID=1121388 RepID=A0A8B6X384_9BURK|nr:uroporphyrinogen-III synthase [Derxia gummosa]